MTKKAEIHPHDRLGRLADLAALIEFGLIGLRECNWKPASHGLGWIAVQIQDELRDVIEVLSKEEKSKRQLRVVGDQDA